LLIGILTGRLAKAFGKMRHEQIKAARQAAQLALFALQDDARPKSQRTAAGRLEEPTLFPE
jgi:hypothetical protein